MSILFAPTKSGIAMFALRIALRHRPHGTFRLKHTSVTAPSQIPHTQATLPTITPVHIERPALEKLHKLSALDPPPIGSEEESQLVSELGELVGLMGLVNEVELPEGDRDEMVRELLSGGINEMVIDEADVIDVPVDGRPGGRVLDLATRRVGDFYTSRMERKSD